MAIYCKFCGYQLTENTGLCPQCGRQALGNEPTTQQGDFYPQQSYQPTQDPPQSDFYTQPPYQPPQNPNQDNFYPQQPYQPTQGPLHNSFKRQPPFQQIQNSHINTFSLIGFILACVSLPLQAGRLMFYGETVELVCGIVGIILSAVGLKQIARSNERGKGFSIAGIIIGSTSVLLLVIVFFILFLLFGLSYYF